MPESRKRACGLIRVSTEEQARGGFGLKFQEEDIRSFCQRADLELLQVFRDEGYSGATSDRPGFKEMMAWARERRFDVLVVWKLDRLFRDTKLTLATIDELASLDIEFRSVQESFTHDSNGRFLLTIFAAGAEKERKDINLRMNSGRVAAAKRGILVNGISNPAYGYRYDTTIKKLLVAEDEARVVRQIFHWFVDERVSLYRIQCRLNEMRVPTKYDRLGRKKRTQTRGWWHKRTIGRILENEIYTGQLVLRKYKAALRTRDESSLRPKEEWISIETPPLVSSAIFDQAQRQLVANSVKSLRNTKKLYLLGKLLVCGKDGRRMQALTMPSGKNGSDVRYYYCNAMNTSNAAVPCRSHYIREDRIFPPVWERIKELLSNPAVVLRQLAAYQEDKSTVSDAVKTRHTLMENKKKTDQQIRRLAEVYIAGAIDKDFYDKEHRRLRDRAETLARELKKVEALALSAERITGSEGAIQTLFEHYQQKLESAADIVRREILQIFVNSIVVRGEELEIEVHLPPVNLIAGQQPYQVSRNDVPVLFLTARLLPSSRVR